MQQSRRFEQIDIARGDQTLGRLRHKIGDALAVDGGIGIRYDSAAKSDETAW